MRKSLIGLFAAALGASSAIAAQHPVENYNATFNVPLTAVKQAQQFTPGRRRPVQQGSITLPSRGLPTLSGYPSSFDGALNSATFLWAAPELKPALVAPLKAANVRESAARQFMLMQAATLNVSKAAAANAKMTEIHDVGEGPIIARFQQMKDGYEVFGRQMNVMMDRQLKLVATSGYFAPDNSAAPIPGHASSASTTAAPTFRTPAEQALAIAFSDMSKKPMSASAFSSKQQKGAYTIYAANGRSGDLVADGETRAKKVMFYAGTQYVPAYYVEVSAHSIDGADQYAYGYVISASDGKVLFRKDQIDYDFTYRTYADANGIHQPFDSPLGNNLDPTSATATNRFLPRVGVPTNLVTLTSGPISTRDPWLAPDATVTTGNNVDAYLDLVAPDGFTPASLDQRASVNGSLTFDYPYTPDANPSTSTQRNAAIVTQFYIDNWLHDWWYDNGFNEAAGNAQTSNFGRGGEEGDNLRAEGQDNSGRNNANESTPADGGHPRQQMFLFDGPLNGEVTINSPGGIGTLAFNSASFGPTTFDVTANVVASAPQNGCTPFTNGAAVAGNIVLIDRGACTFQTKTVNAQAAGAVGVILANNAAGAPPALGADATQPNPTIGTLSISQADGATVRAAVGAGTVNARLRRSPSIDIDGTVDIHIIAHEWFHTTSNRLVGNASGLSSQQGRGMGEGWSDFSSLMLTVRPEDRLVAGNENYQGIYPVAYYATRDNYYGIRRAPYSTNFAVFPMTFRHISDGVALPTTAPLAFGQNGATNSEVHNTGEIWANTLWEIYAALLNDPRYSFIQAQTRMKNYVIAGLKMTPNAPTILEARDAILAAARATNAADFNLIATAFAKRGMGIGAVAPNRNSTTNANAIEDFTALAGRLSVTEAKLDFSYFSGSDGFIDNDGILDPGETAQLQVSVISNGTADVTSPIVANLSSSGDVTFGNNGQIVFPASPSAPIAFGTVVTGTTTVHLNSATQTAQPITITLNFADGATPPSGAITPQPITFNLAVNYDVLPNSKANDNFEAPLASVRDWTSRLFGLGTNWALTSATGLVGTTGTGWFAVDNSGATDVQLESPTLQAGTGFSLAFDHYFSFETATPTIGFDGGVIEISTDGGSTWVDAVDAGGQFTAGGYNGVLLALSPSGVVVPDDDADGHPGFVNNNGSINVRALQHVVLNFGDAFAGQAVKVRFREATDNGGASLGWFIDNVAFTGVSNLPFSTIVAEDGNADNAAPVANAGASQVKAVGAKVTLDGTASTDDVGVTSYAWTQLSGPTVSLSNPAAAQPTFTATARGTAVFQLTVSDKRAATSSATVSVTMIDAPVSDAGNDQVVRKGAGVTLNGAASSVDAGSTATYEWSQLSGPTATLSDAAAASPTFTADTAGTLVFQLTVTDASAGASSADTVSIAVVDAPVANAGVDQSVSNGAAVTLNGSGSTFGTGATPSYAWTQVSGPSVTLSGANSASPTFSAGTAGTLVFQLTVSDSRIAATSSDTVSVTVAAAPTRGGGGGGAFGLTLLVPGALLALLRRRRMK